ncbi:DUF2141 domain-containing protein [Agaribacter flavus]|uniref:DUF2141 domain-containing protein n=1 Tax=Agaribacter flavus TaxID=1902781 RepID=A0ABV7FWG4_9ALTE
MKRLISTLTLVASTAVFSTHALASTIDFHIDGIKDNKGKLYIQLFKGEEDYHNGKARAATIVTADSHSKTVTFNNIDAGEYALRFFHDENDNGQLDTNLFGLPSEGYGFSNDAKPNFGPVQYDEIKFVVDEATETTSNTTHVIY